MYYIGVDLGGTNIVVGLVDEQGKIIEKLHKPTNKARGIKLICDDIAMLCKQLIHTHKLTRHELDSIGIGAPGIIDRKKGRIVYSNNIEVNDFDMVSYIKKSITNFPIYIANDADCAALGEVIAGGAKGYSSAIVVTLGTGVGSGIIIDGKIFSGFYPGAAELGHQIIVKDGRQCTCGNKGCLETYASATGLITLAREQTMKNPSSLMNALVRGDLSKMTAKIPFDAARREDQVARKVINSYMDHLAIGLANMISAFGPEIILIGGGVSRQKEALINPLVRRIKQIVFGGKLRTRIDVATLGNDAGLIGAAMLGRN